MRAPGGIDGIGALTQPGDGHGDGGGAGVAGRRDAERGLVLMRRYTNLFERLVSNTHEPENDQACWFWKCKVDRHCYGRINVYVKGLGTETTLQAHVALWVWLHASAMT